MYCLASVGHVGAERVTEPMSRSGAYVWISFTFNFPPYERRYVAVSDRKPMWASINIMGNLLIGKIYFIWFFLNGFDFLIELRSWIVKLLKGLVQRGPREKSQCLKHSQSPLLLLSTSFFFWWVGFILSVESGFLHLAENVVTNSARFMSQIQLSYWPQSWIKSKDLKTPGRELFGPARFSFLSLHHLTEAHK